MKFNKAKYKVLLLGWHNHEYQCKLKDERIESSHVEKDLGILVEEKLDKSWQCVLASKKVVDCIKISKINGGDSTLPS